MQTSGKVWTSTLRIPDSPMFIRSDNNRQSTNGNVGPSYSAGRRRILCPSEEWFLARNPGINPQTTAKQVMMLAETGKTVSRFTVKPVLYRMSWDEKGITPNPLKKRQIIVCNYRWRPKSVFLETCSALMRQKPVGCTRIFQETEPKLTSNLSYNVA